MKRLALSFGLCMIVADVALADTIDSNTVSFDFSTTLSLADPTPLGSFSGVLQQFNPVLGTLTGVTAEINIPTISTNIDLEVVDGTGGEDAHIVADFDLFLGLTLQGFNGGANFSFDDFFQHTFFCGAQTGSCGIGEAFSGSDTQALIVTDLTGYTGTSTLPIMFTSSPSISNLVIFPNGIGTALYRSTDVAGTVFLEFTYTPAQAGTSTPEPGSIALLGAGLGFIGYRKAFQTRTVAPARNPRSA